MDENDLQIDYINESLFTTSNTGDDDTISKISLISTITRTLMETVMEKIMSMITIAVTFHCN